MLFNFFKKRKEEEDPLHRTARLVKEATEREEFLNKRRELKSLLLAAKEEIEFRLRTQGLLDVSLWDHRDELVKVARKLGCHSGIKKIAKEFESRGFQVKLQIEDNLIFTRYDLRITPKKR